MLIHNSARVTHLFEINLGVFYHRNKDAEKLILLYAAG